MAAEPAPQDTPMTPDDRDVSFTLLGPLEVRKDGRDHAPTAPKILQLLAMLLLRPGKVVPAELIIKELWADNPPRSVRTTMQTYIWQLRRCIEENGLAADGDEILATKPPGYVLHVASAQIDVFAFQRFGQQGRTLLDERRHAEAAAAFRSALGLWWGPPLANVNSGPVLSAYAMDLQEQRRTVQHLRFQAEIEAGMHRDLIGELRSLVATNPLDESLHSQLMQVLSRSGRRVEALATYRQLRAKLNEELGLEPCLELQDLHHQLLSAGERVA